MGVAGQGVAALCVVGALWGGAGPLLLRLGSAESGS